jgi:hypothetical protein
MGRAFKKAARTIGHAAESVGRDIVHGAEKVGHGIVHGVETVGREIVHGAEKVGHGIVHGAEFVGKGILHGGEELFHLAAKATEVVVGAGNKVLHVVIDGVEHAVGDLIGLHMRQPTTGEWNVVESVFANQVPTRDRILIVSKSGLSDRPFTIPGSLIMGAGMGVGHFIPILGQVVMFACLWEHLWDKYLLCLGPKGYKDALNFYSTDFYNPDTNGPGRPGSTLVHEMTHVWQGYHKAFSWWYIFDSLYNQACCGSKAYDYRPLGKNWSAYGCEAQAHIVEDWWLNGAVIGSEWYPYMVSNIWTGNTGGATIFGTNPGQYFRGLPTLHPHLRF